MAISIRFRVTGLDETIRELSQMKERASNLAPFWRSVASPRITSQLGLIFRQEGPGWAPLSPYTLAVRLYPGYPILQQTGRLMREVVQDPVETFTASTYTRDTVNPYAIDHELGDPSRNLPDRPFLVEALHRSADGIVSELAEYILGS